MSRSQELIAVYKAAGELEAQVIKGLLESYGIPCFLKSHVAPSVHVLTVDGLGEVKIMVQESLVEKAKKLIEREEHV